MYGIVGLTKCAQYHTIVIYIPLMYNKVIYINGIILHFGCVLIIYLTQTTMFYLCPTERVAFVLMAEFVYLIVGVYFV